MVSKEPSIYVSQDANVGSKHEGRQVMDEDICFYFPSHARCAVETTSACLRSVLHEGLHLPASL